MKRIQSHKTVIELCYEVIVDEHELRNILRQTYNIVSRLKKNDVISAYENVKGIEDDVRRILRRNDRLEVPNKETE